MAASHVDHVNQKTWTFSIVCAVLTFINVAIHLAACNFPGLGYPCVYFHVVDLTKLNMSHFNAYHMLTPQLYLDQVQLVVYVIFAEFVFLMVLVYYIVCWAKIALRREPGTNLNQSTRDISYLGDSLSCFMFILTMDTFQIYTLMLSFRLPSMISFAYFLHFICLTIFVVTMVTQYQSYDRSSFALSKVHPNLSGTVKMKTVVVNAIELLLGFSTMVLAMSLCLGFGNNFFVKTGHMVYGTLTVMGFVMALFFIVIEAVLHRYMKVQVGYHLGALFGLCGALYPILKYDTITAPGYVQGINIFLGCLFLLWLVFTLCRVIRFFTRRQRKYKPLPNLEEIKQLRTETEE